jgi:ABC-2 type transport system permease protein
MTIRRGETLLLTVGIPVALLVFFSLSHVTASPLPHRVDFVAPGILALCVLSTSLVALSIATGFERSYGVLRRLHVTPLGRGRLIAAKITGVLVTELIQIAVIVAVAYGLGWSPRGGLVHGLVLVAILVLGSIGCAGIGLALAGRLRAEVNLAASNGLYVVLLLISGIVLPLGSLPAALGTVARALPPGAMADGTFRLLGQGVMPRPSDWITLAAWSLLAPLFAARTFRFD